PGEEQHHRHDRHGGDHHADADPAASFGGGNLAIHAGPLVKPRARSREAGVTTVNDLRAVPALPRPAPYEPSSGSGRPIRRRGEPVVRVASRQRSSMQERERNTPPRSAPTAL